MSPIRILIVDDHNIARYGLRAIIKILPDMEVIGEATNGREAVQQVAALRPDLVLMDLVMPEADGVHAIMAIKQDWPGLPIIALTTFAEADLVLGAVHAGADGYLLKDVDVAELALAIRTVHSGHPYLHPAATRHLLQATARPEPPAIQLTRREQTVLGLLARGMTNRQIAERLVVSEKTASVHVSNILGKLGLSSRTQAALYAARAGIVPLDLSA